MLGLIRFALAFAVLLSHVPGFVWVANPGVVSVVCFYAISGYLMRRSYARFSARARAPVRDFLLDRALKLFPQYLLVVGVTAALLHLWGPSRGFWLLQQEPTPGKVLLNAMLLPANYIFPPFVIPALLPHPLVPPAWSLATEFHFYLLLPLLFAAPRLTLGLLACTLAVQLTGFAHAAPPFNAESLSYRYIFGILPAFLLGYYQAGERPGDRRIAFGLWAVYAGVLAGLLAGVLPMQQRALDVALGSTIALPLLVVGLRRRPAAGAAWRVRLDERIGNLAYPVFITHCLSFLLLENLAGSMVRPTGGFVLQATAVCIGVSLLLDAMQARVERRRYALRGFDSLRREPVATR